MSSITYSERHTVKLDGKTIGEIRAVYQPRNDFPSNRQPGNLVGYRYHPKGDKIGGELFNTLRACQLSVHGEPPSAI